MKHFITDCEAIYEEKWMSNYGRCFKQVNVKVKFNLEHTTKAVGGSKV